MLRRALIGSRWRFSGSLRRIYQGREKGLAHVAKKSLKLVQNQVYVKDVQKEFLNSAAFQCQRKEEESRVHDQKKVW